MAPGRRICSRFIESLSVVLVSLLPASSISARPATIRDLIEYTAVGSSNPAEAANRIQFSPGRNWISFLTHRGDLASNTQEFQLHIYDVRAVSHALSAQSDRAPLPLRTIEMRTATNSDAISGIRWIDDDTMVFFGDDVTHPGSFHAYRYRASNDQLEDLTAGIDGAEAVCGIEATAFSAVIHSCESSEIPAETRPAFLSASDVFRGLLNIPSRSVVHRLIVQLDGQQSWQLGKSFRVINGRSDLTRTRSWLSPDGHLGLFNLPEELLPANSHAEERPDSPPQMIERSRGFHLVIVDLLDRTFHRLTNGDASGPGEVVDALWASPDSVLILRRLPARQPASSRSALAIDCINARSGESAAVARLTDTEIPPGSRPSLQWLPGHSAVGLVTNSGRRMEYALVRSGTRWRAASESELHRLIDVDPAPGLSVSVEESANSPPRVIASMAGRSLYLTPPDPRLRGVEFAPVELLEWTDDDGTRQRGGLIVADDAQERRDQRRPLVILLVSGFDPSRFAPSGGEPVASFAAQALASKRLAVLLFDCGRTDGRFPVGTPDEAPNILRGIDSAVALLTRRGLIDSNQVGLIGQSRTGYYLSYAITHAGRTKFAAAVSDEGNTGSYTSYLIYLMLAANSRDPAAPFPTGVPDYDSRYGGDGNFWANPEPWFHDAPGFRLNRVQTPLLLVMSSNGFDDPPTIWDMEFYGGLRALGRPVEYLYNPQGAHVTLQPEARFAVQSAAVDWLTFWLTGQEDETQGKHDQFERWRAMRDAWRRQQRWEASGNPVGSIPTEDSVGRIPAVTVRR